MDDQSSSTFLFINSAGPSAGRDQDERTRRRIRRHVMRDIGQARRKTSRNPQYELAFDPPARPALQLVPLGNPRRAALPRLPAEQTARGGYSPLAQPFLERDPFVLMDEYLGMDAFAAYGFALVSSSARDPSSRECSYAFPISLFRIRDFTRGLTVALKTIQMRYSGFPSPLAPPRCSRGCSRVPRDLRPYTMKPKIKSQPYR